jgi:hypothetical protein
MPAIFETTMFRAHWGYSRIEPQKNKKIIDIGVIEPNVRAIEDELASVMAQIEQGNWEIKSTLPLIASEYATHSTINKQMDQSYAYGYGYGAAFTDGIIFLCQRKIELSDDEFSTREQTRLTQETARKTERLKAFETEFPITQKRKLLGGTIHIFKGKEYTTKAAAEADRNEILARMK